LTKAEEQVMQILWQLKEAIVKDIIEEYLIQNLPTIPYQQL
jgi:predicted transcriptional regulator